MRLWIARSRCGRRASSGSRSWRCFRCRVTPESPLVIAIHVFFNDISTRDIIKSHVRRPSHSRDRPGRCVCPQNQSWGLRVTRPGAVLVQQLVDSFGLIDVIDAPHQGASQGYRRQGHIGFGSEPCLKYSTLNGVNVSRCWSRHGRWDEQTRWPSIIVLDLWKCHILGEIVHLQINSPIRHRHSEARGGIRLWSNCLARIPATGPGKLRDIGIIVKVINPDSIASEPNCRKTRAWYRGYIVYTIVIGPRTGGARTRSSCFDDSAVGVEVVEA